MRTGQPPGAAGPRSFAICAILSVVGGYVDAGSYLLTGSFTGHITGNSVLTAIALVTGHWSQAASCIIAVLGFMIGTAAGSVWPRSDRHGFGRRLVKPLLAEAALVGLGLSLATWHIVASHDLLLVCLCLALGLQNGTVTKLDGVSVRTSFITGMSTSLVTAMTGGRPDRKTRILPLVLGCFLLGAICGALLTARFELLGFGAVLLPLLLALVLSATAPTGQPGQGIGV